MLHKRILSAASAVIVCALLCACKAPELPAAAPTEAPAETVSPAPSQSEAPAAFLEGKLVSIDDSSLLLAGSGEAGGPGALYSFSAKGLSLTDEAGAPLSPDGLTAGMEVELGYSGLIAESYPAQPSGVLSLRVLSRENDLVGLYLQAIDDLHQQDPALNDGITLLAFDLSGANNLSEAEKSALILLAAGRYGLEPLSGAFEELCEQGYIDREALYFSDGLLYTIKTGAAAGEDSFSFSISKWRSGLGALGHEGCTAVFENGQGSYEAGSTWIS